MNLVQIAAVSFLWSTVILRFDRTINYSGTSKLIYFTISLSSVGCFVSCSDIHHGVGVARLLYMNYDTLPAVKTM